MSDRSERIKEFLDKSHKNMAEKITGDKSEEETNSGMINAGAHSLFTDNQVFIAQMEYYTKLSCDAIRRVFYEMNGHAPWTSPLEAEAQVRDKLLDKLLPLPFMALADGVQLASENPSFAVKKYRRMDLIHMIYDSEAFIRDSELIAMEYMDDEDCVNLMKGALVSTVAAIGTLSGYWAYTGTDINHVWDLYAMACRSVTTQMWMAGQELGETTSTDDILAGILAASEKGGES